MAKFEIQKGVPMPNTRPGKELKYPFDQLGKGDSFLVTDEGDMKSVVSCARAYGKRYGIELIARKTSEGMRVWRLDGEVKRRKRRTKAEIEADNAQLAAGNNADAEAHAREAELAALAEAKQAETPKQETEKPKRTRRSSQKKGHSLKDLAELTQ